MRHSSRHPQGNGNRHEPTNIAKLAGTSHELPVTEDQWHRLSCPCCHEKMCVQSPAAGPAGTLSDLEEVSTNTFDGVVNRDRENMHSCTTAADKECCNRIGPTEQGLIDDPNGQVARWEYDLMRCTRGLSRHWSRCRDGMIRRAATFFLAQLISCASKDVRRVGLFSTT
jgi:hypothetical protein